MTCGNILLLGLIFLTIDIVERTAEHYWKKYKNNQKKERK